MLRSITYTFLVLSFLGGVPNSVQAGLKEDLKQCRDSGLKALIKANSKSFSSPEYGLTCNPGTLVNFGTTCNKDNQTRWFEYAVSKGFHIGSAKFNVTSQTERTWHKNFSFNKAGAKIQMHCGGHGCGGQGRVWVKGNVVGTLVYEPTAGDFKAISDKCFDDLIK